MAKSKRPATTIMLPHARAQQLRDLAKNEAVSVVELIERFINRAIEEGDLADNLPRFPIWASGMKVVCVLDNIVLPALTPGTARVLADVIMSYVNLEKSQNSKPAKLRDGTILMVRRAGRGLAIIAKDVDGALNQASMTLQMGRDLARQLRKQADLAESTS
jgi:hypothetical protein